MIWTDFLVCSAEGVERSVLESLLCTKLGYVSVWTFYRYNSVIIFVHTKVVQFGTPNGITSGSYG